MKSATLVASTNPAEPEDLDRERWITLDMEGIVGRALLVSGVVSARASEMMFWVAESCWSAAFRFSEDRTSLR